MFLVRRVESGQMGCDNNSQGQVEPTVVICIRDRDNVTRNFDGQAYGLVGRGLGNRGALCEQNERSGCNADTLN